MQKERLEIPVIVKGYTSVLTIYGSSNNSQLFEEEHADDLGEAKWQLVEGEEYEYEFEEVFFFKEHELVYPSKSTKTRGLIKTGTYVGCLNLTITNDAGIETEVSFEIRSVKVNYRHDYQTMLHDITCHFTELVMMQGAPVTQRFDVDVNEDSRTLYQQFAFLKSLVDSEEFEDALNKILYNPIHKWAGTTIEKDICSVRRLGRKTPLMLLRTVLSSSCYILFFLSAVTSKNAITQVKD